jgi:hypothetical protein
MANGEWYFARGNQQQGPVALQAIQDMLRTGQLQPTDLVWRQGMASWQAASQVPELYAQQGQPAAPMAPAPPNAPPGQPPPGQLAAPGQPKPYYRPQPMAPRQTVPNYLVQSILVTLFCCLPFGIVSIVYAAQVNSKLAAGDYAGALDASQKAKTWSMWSFIIGLVFGVGYFVLMIMMAAVQPH